MNHIQQVVELISSGLGVGDPRQSGPVTLVPLFGGAKAKDYLVAAEAFAAGTLHITEVGGGEVPQVGVVNDSHLPVLFLDGEHIEGAMQNRVLNTTVLVAARHKTVLPVSCVEHGRWHYEEGVDFSPSDDVAYSRLRARNTADVAASARAGTGRLADQGAVWADVAQKHAEVGVEHSLTGSMRDAYDHRRVELDAIRQEFLHPEAGQTGGRRLSLGTRPISAGQSHRQSPRIVAARAKPLRIPSHDPRSRGCP